MFGEDFHLATPTNVGETLKETLDTKEWTFGNHRDPRKFEVRSIVAKSDFLRMKLVHDLGGYWLDADTIGLSDFRSDLDDRVSNTSDLFWHSEAFFGARPGNEILKDASQNMLAQDRQVWGNPGNLKELVRSREGSVRKISFDFVRTGYAPEYSYQTQDVMLRRDLEPEEFLTNEKQSIIKLYNTPLSETTYSQMSIEEFLSSGILLARIFLSLEPLEYWLEHSRALQHEITH